MCARASELFDFIGAYIGTSNSSSSSFLCVCVSRVIAIICSRLKGESWAVFIVIIRWCEEEE